MSRTPCTQEGFLLHEWLCCSSMGSHERYPKPTAAGALQATIWVSTALFHLRQSADLPPAFGIGFSSWWVQESTKQTNRNLPINSKTSTALTPTAPST